MNGYSVKVVESSRELSAKEKVLFKDTTNCTKLDEATKEDAVIIEPEMYVVLEIHNEKSDNKDYENYVIVDKNGERFITGSKSFWDSFSDIFADMAEVEESYQIKAYRRPSKNYVGRDFLTCSII